jgi:hypothetical protein
MTVDELFERIFKVHGGDTSASIDCNLDPDPCPNWFERLEWPDRFTLMMIDYFLVAEMGFSPANYNNLTPYAESNPIVARYNECRPAGTWELLLKSLVFRVDQCGNWKRLSTAPFDGPSRFRCMDLFQV